MDPLAHLAIATMTFLITHAVPSTPLRGALVRSLGERQYLGAFSLVSFLTLGWTIYAYGHAPLKPLWQVTGLKLLPLFVMPFAFILLTCGVMGRNPTAVRQESALESEHRGILRVTRHPMMWGFALWAAAHLLARGDAASLIFFGGFLVLALSGTVLIDMRKSRAPGLGEAWKRFAGVTSNLPFQAILEGRNRFRPGEIGWIKILSGIALYAVFFVLHPQLFRVSPY